MDALSLTMATKTPQNLESGDINVTVVGKQVVGSCVKVSIIIPGSTVERDQWNELPHLLHAIGHSDYAKDTGVTSGFDYAFDLIFD